MRAFGFMMALMLLCACTTPFSPSDVVRDKDIAIRLGKIACLSSEDAFDKAVPGCKWRGQLTGDQWILVCGYPRVSQRAAKYVFDRAYSFNVAKSDGAVSDCLFYA